MLTPGTLHKVRDHNYAFPLKGFYWTGRSLSPKTIIMFVRWPKDGELLKDLDIQKHRAFGVFLVEEGLYIVECTPGVLEEMGR